MKSYASVLDVSGWSRFHPDQKHPMWWGILGLILIEALTVAGFVISYFYLALPAEGTIGLAPQDVPWVAAGPRPLPLLYPTIILGLLLVCAASMWYAGVVIQRNERHKGTAAFVVCTVAGLAVLVFRWLQLEALPFKWSDHAYGSCVWLLLGFHFAHVVSAIVGTAAIGVLVWQGYFNHERRIAVQVDTMYWYFVSFEWIPIYVVLYWLPRWA